MSAPWLGFLGFAVAAAAKLDVPEKGREIAVEAAMLCLRAGITRTEWLLMSAEERAVCVEAGDRIWRERIGMLAMAIHDKAIAERLLEVSPPAQDKKAAAIQEALAGGGVP